MRTYLITIIICILQLTTAAAVEFKPLCNTDAKFPQVLHFRNDSFAARLKVEDEQDRIFKKYINQFDGFMPKLAMEENTGLPMDRLHAFYHDIQKAHPEKLYLIHFNGEAVAVQHHKRREDKGYYAENLADYFPGHWAFKKGTLLKKDIGLLDNVLEVENGKLFSMKDYIFYNARKRGKDVSFPTDMVIVALDHAGKRIWQKAEYITLESEGISEITVRRGRYGSSRQSFKGGRAMILPIIGCSWASNSMWLYNFSADCPRDTNGLQAADIYARNLAQIVKGTKDCRFVEGIAFDVLHFSASSEVDSNNDNVADGGYVDGVNRWRVGTVKLLENLRKQLGPEVIMSADSHHETNQRAVGILNGMESEGLVSHNDGYRGISTTINVHTYWQAFGRDRRFSYIADKLRHDEDLEQKDKLVKLAHGTATVLGVGIGMLDLRSYLYKDHFDYLTAGNPSRQPGWLGKPILPMKLMKTKDYSSSKGNHLIDSAVVVNAELKAAGRNEWMVKGIGKGALQEVGSFEEAKRKKVRKGIPLQNIQMVLKDMDLSKGLIVKMELKSESPLKGLQSYPAIPRFVEAAVSENVHYNKNRLVNEQYRTCQGVMGASGWHTNIFYFRANPVSKVDLKLAFEGLGDFRIKNVEVITGPLVLSRFFEKGAVVVNLSEKSVSVTIDSPLKMLDAESEKPLDRTMTLQALDTCFIRLFGQ